MKVLMGALFLLLISQALAVDAYEKLWDEDVKMAYSLSQNINVKKLSSGELLIEVPGGPQGETLSETVQPGKPNEFLKSSLPGLKKLQNFWQQQLLELKKKNDQSDVVQGVEKSLNKLNIKLQKIEDFLKEHSTELSDKTLNTQNIKSGKAKGHKKQEPAN